MIENQDSAATETYSIVKHHERESGLIQVPLATDDGSPSCEIIRLHNPIERLAVHWTATKVGGAPIVPHPDLFASNHTFLHGVRTVAAPMLEGVTSSAGAAFRDAQYQADASGQNISYQKTGQESQLTHSWGMTGVYYYAMSTPVGLASDFIAGKMPFDNIAIADTVIPAAYFKKGFYEEEIITLTLGIPTST